MPKEGRNQQPRNAELFGLTHTELLFDSVSEKRFTHFFQDEQTTVQEIKLSENVYGEFLFITLSREVDGNKIALVFWGLGYHDQREQWLTDGWRWYEHSTPLTSSEAATSIPKTNAKRQIEERRSEVLNQAENTRPSERAMLFAILADLTDEDGALAELQDFDDLSSLSWILYEDTDE